MQWRNKKIIVTGGAGVIGKELIKKLIEKRAKIRCFDIASEPHEFSSKIEYYQKDLCALNPIEFISFEPEMIFHLAAAFERTEEDINFWELNYFNNTLLSHKVLDVAKKCKSLQNFIFASSYLIYNPSLYLSEKPFIESVKLKETDILDSRNLCGAAKQYTEKEMEYLNNFKEQYPFINVSARIFRVYGKGSKDIISRWIKTGLKNEPTQVFLKENFFNYIFAEDVAEGLLKIAENNIKGIVNLGSRNSRRISEVIEIIKQQIPKMEIKEINKKGLFEGSCADISKLKQQTIWEPTITLEQGIKKIIDYEYSNNKRV